MLALNVNELFGHNAHCYCDMHENTVIIFLSKDSFSSVY